jgi:hypothetical protein
MKIKLTQLLVWCSLAVFFTPFTTHAQFTLTGQLRTRTELRAGQGTLQQRGDVPALFTSQRSRLNFGYTGYRFKVFTAIQDVRVWGQDASSINRTTTEANNGLMLHEAWGEIMLIDTVSPIENLSLKLGRQEIAYDDQKILGSLDWLQQARHHDAAVLKFANKGWMADLGAAFNQNKELQTNSLYNGIPGSGTGNGGPVTSALYPAGTNGIGTMYKSFQYVYLGKKFYFGNASLLFFRDNFNQYAGTTKVPVRGEWSRLTMGGYINAVILRKLTVTGSAYYQGGQDKDGKDMAAALASITLSYQVGRKFSMGPGVDYLSGDDGTQKVTADSKNQRFDPLYGTPHKFWGYMDYFYVASGFGKQGLLNYFWKTKYKAQDNLVFTADLHGFSAANTLSDGKGGTLDSYLGTELDLVMNYGYTKMVNIELGYCGMLAKTSMASAAVKGVVDPQLHGQWAYLMISIKPNFMAK